MCGILRPWDNSLAEPTNASASMEVVAVWSQQWFRFVVVELGVPQAQTMAWRLQMTLSQNAVALESLADSM
jgi:hypothetical protein